MFIQKLILNNFKNNENSSIVFTKKCSVFVGKNGEGKTNILESIYYLSVFKSYFGLNDKDLVLADNDYFFLSCMYDFLEEKNQLICGFRIGEKKNIKINNKSYDKLSEHIGKFPVIFLTPFDIDLIREGSEQRRKFFDLIISTNSSEYLQKLIEYNKILEQRNKYLKLISQSKNIDFSLFEVYDLKLTPHGNYIFEQRKHFIEQFMPIFQKYYSLMASNNENAEIEYTSPLFQDEFSNLLKLNFDKDLLLERTSVGIHKDDYVFKINAKESGKYASQGQLKSYVIALKLAQFEIIYQKLGVKPITLLDDIFDRLDADRSKKLMDIIKSDFFGQIVITDTDSKRILTYFEEVDKLAIFKVENGNVSFEK